MKLKDLAEAFNDIGKLTPEQLQKGQRLDANAEGNFVRVPGRVFHQAVSQLSKWDGLRESPRGLETLTIYPVSKYNKMKCYLGMNNTAGYAIKDGDELVSVFSTAGSSGNAIVADAVKNGAKVLDCFAIRGPDGKIGGPLVNLYSRYGFRIDTSVHMGKKGEPFSVWRGQSSYVNDDGEVEPDNPNIVVFMRRG